MSSRSRDMYISSQPVCVLVLCVVVLLCCCFLLLNSDWPFSSRQDSTVKAINREEERRKRDTNSNSTQLNSTDHTTRTEHTVFHSVGATLSHSTHRSIDATLYTHTPCRVPHDPAPTPTNTTTTQIPNRNTRMVMSAMMMLPPKMNQKSLPLPPPLPPQSPLVSLVSPSTPCWAYRRMPHPM